MNDEPRGLSRARTKIIATVGPACRSEEQLAELIAAGVDVFRLNMAHADVAEHGRALVTIRRLEQRLARPLGVLVDLAGPKIRLGEIAHDAIECPLDAEFEFVRGDAAPAPNQLVTTYPRLVDELQVGDTLMLADGTVGMTVIERSTDAARCRVFQPGSIRSRQGLNLPGVKLSAPAMDDEDRGHAQRAADNGADLVGLSFVRARSDVVELKSLLAERHSRAGVIAKIEKPEALDALDDIVTAADGVMVARGDLGVEIDIARMPVVQKQIVATCRRLQKPVIIATQMLDSMQQSPRPTRAEVTDIANAILDGGDACMLSGETAIGKYPREAVAMMNRVALATETLFEKSGPQHPGETRAAVAGLKPVTSAIVYGAGHIAARIDARLIVAASHTGATALALSKQRTFAPTVGISDSEATLRRMSLYWGVIPLPAIPIASNEEILQAVTAWGLADGTLRRGDHVVLVAGTGLYPDSHNGVTVHRIP